MNQESDRDLSALYRAGAAEEPPASLDRRVLRAARAAEPVSWRYRFTQLFSGWQAGFGVAAVLVLCVSLVLVMKDEALDIAKLESPPVAAPAPEADKLLGHAPSGPESRAVPSEKRELAEPGIASSPLPLRSKGQMQPRSSELGDTAPRASAMPRPPQTAQIDNQEQAAQSATRAPRADLPSMEPAESAPAAPAEVVPSPRAAAPALPERSQARLEAEPAARAAGRSAPAAKAARVTAAEDALRADPAAWLASIERLVRSGREGEAVRQLEQFRQRYPEQRLPRELERVLGARLQADSPASAATRRSSPQSDEPASD